ncbi:MAG: hypothetical protein R3B06_13125 [Kofleriaceae bacterium]
MIARAAHVALALALALALAATPAAATPAWQTATADERQAARAYDEAMLAGDDALALAVASQVREPRRRLVERALRAYALAAMARPEAVEPHQRAAATLRAFYVDCRADDDAALCDGRGDRVDQVAGERLIDAWNAIERLAPMDPQVVEHILFDRAIVHTKLFVGAHLEAALADYQTLLARRGVTGSSPLLSAVGQRATVLGNLAETEMMLGRLDDAIDHYREAFGLSGDVAHGYGLAVALDRDEQRQAAAEVLARMGRATVEDFPLALGRGGIFYVPAGEVYYYLGLGAEFLGDDVAALEHFQTYLASGANPRYQPRAVAHVAAARARLARRRGAR